MTSRGQGPVPGVTKSQISNNPIRANGVSQSVKNELD